MSPTGRRSVLLAFLVLALFAAGWVRWKRAKAPAPMPLAVPGLSTREVADLVERVEAIEARERLANETFWRPELLAQRCGRRIDELWDELNGASDPWATVREFMLPRIRIPRWATASETGHGIQVWSGGSEGLDLDAAGWRDLVENVQGQGWRLSRVEFRHNAFTTNRTGGPASSSYAFSAWLEQAQPPRRATVEGDLRIHWSGTVGADDGLPIEAADASLLRLTMREGPPAFLEVWQEEVAPPARSHFIDPILVHDLDADGRPEIILAARNRVYRRTAEGGFSGSALCRSDPGLIFTALMADLNQDGATDFLCARAEGLHLFPGTPAGRFEAPGQAVWSAPNRLRYGQVLTAADVDGDGDLDVWLGQYKNPYERGQMPTPYHDANDGHPAYLLLNDGTGQLRDATESSALAPRRHRRSYSGSLADLNADDAPDLLTVSDFAGVDLYWNDGTGRFRDARSRFSDPLGFGMAHAFADFDGDGRLDIFVTGMHCPTASRLESLGLGRPGFESLDARRSRMIQGNRLYVGTSDGFATTGLNRSVARSGWSWGCAAADFDNDGFVDLYIANGHETRQSTMDYESEFWLHDIYLASSEDDLTLAAYFGAKFARTRGQGQSYGGYEANRFYLNRQGVDFLETGWLLGGAVPQDSRNAVAADLDADGRMDLAVTTFEVWPRTRQTIRVFHNALADAGHWVGARLRPTPGVSALGSHITVSAGDRRFVRLITSGDSHRSQQPWTAHIGLGVLERVDALEVRWPGGRITRIENPGIDSYHDVRGP